MSPRKNPERGPDEQNPPTEATRDALRQALPDALRVPQLFIAGPDGCFEDGETWISLVAARERGGISRGALREYLRAHGHETRYARSAEGAVVKFCRHSDIARFFIDLPRADEHGYCLVGSHRFAAIGRWADVLNVTDAVLKKYIGEAKLEPISCRDRMGRILPFYEEQGVRAAAAALLEVLPRADETGFFALEAMRYGTFRAWSRALGIASHVVAHRIKKLEITGRDGRDGKGERHTFYPENEVRRACAELLEDLPFAEPSGFFEREGVRYGSIRAWARELGSNDSTVKPRLTAAACPSIRGRDPARKVVPFFAEHDVEHACVDLLTDSPRADTAGFFTIDGERYGTVFAWKKELGVSQRTIESRIERAQLEPLTGVDVGGNRQPFYAESRVREACADFLQDLPRTSQPLFERDGCRFGLVRQWARELGISTLAIQRRLDASGAVPSPAFFRGRREQFYEEADVRRACGELLEDLPTTDDSGFVEISGIRHGSVYTWSKELGLAKQTILKCLKRDGIMPARAKSVIGVVRDIYAEDVVRSATRAFLEARSARGIAERRSRLSAYLARVAAKHVPGTPYIVSRAGFLEMEGSILGTKRAWLRAFIAHDLHIPKKAQMADWNARFLSVTWRTWQGPIAELYREDDVISMIQDFA